MTPRPTSSSAPTPLSAYPRRNSNPSHPPSWLIGQFDKPTAEKMNDRELLRRLKTHATGTAVSSTASPPPPAQRAIASQHPLSYAEYHYDQELEQERKHATEYQKGIRRRKLSATTPPQTKAYGTQGRSRAPSTPHGKTPGKNPPTTPPTGFFSKLFRRKSNPKTPLAPAPSPPPPPPPPPQEPAWALTLATALASSVGISDTRLISEDMAEEEQYIITLMEKLKEVQAAKQVPTGRHGHSENSVYGGESYASPSARRTPAAPVRQAATPGTFPLFGMFGSGRKEGGKERKGGRSMSFDEQGTILNAGKLRGKGERRFMSTDSYPSFTDGGSSSSKKRKNGLNSDSVRSEGMNSGNDIELSLFSMKYEGESCEDLDGGFGGRESIYDSGGGVRVNNFNSHPADGRNEGSADGFGRDRQVSNSLKKSNLLSMSSEALYDDWLKEERESSERRGNVFDSESDEEEQFERYPRDLVIEEEREEERSSADRSSGRLSPLRNSEERGSSQRGSPRNSGSRNSRSGSRNGSGLTTPTRTQQATTPPPVEAASPATNAPAAPGSPPVRKKFTDILKSMHPTSAAAFLRAMSICGFGNMVFLAHTAAWWYGEMASVGPHFPPTIEDLGDIVTLRRVPDLDPLARARWFWLIAVIAINLLKLPFRIHTLHYIGHVFNAPDRATSQNLLTSVVDSWMFRLHQNLGRIVQYLIGVGFLCYFVDETLLSTYLPTSFPQPACENTATLREVSLKAALDACCANLLVAAMRSLLAIGVLYTNEVRQRRREDMRTVNRARRGLLEREMDALQKETFETRTSESETRDVSQHSRPICSICLDRFETGDRLWVLPCDSRHRFHGDCIKGWLGKNSSCPLCTRNVRGDRAAMDEEEGGSSPEQRGSNISAAESTSES